MIVADDGDAFARAVAAAYAADTKGIVTFVAVTSFDVRGSMMYHQHKDDQTAYAEEDGARLAMRVISEVDDGVAQGPAALSALSAEAEVPTGRFGMRLPIMPAALADYRFGKPRQEATTVTVDFTADVRDAAHGDGTLTYDVAGNRIVQIVYRPATLPPHATAIVTTITFADVGAGRWDMVKLSRTFAGRIGPLHGGGSSTTTFANYRSAPSEAAAIAALGDMRPD